MAKTSPEFEFTTAFHLEAEFEELTVRVTHDVNDFTKPLSVAFIDHNADAMVSVPAELFDRVVASVKAKWEV